MSDDYNTAGTLDAFYVYRTLHSDESWNAILGICNVNKLPNIDFGMMIYAKNEREAIARGRHLYEKIHKWDSDRDNIRRFAAAALKSTIAYHLGKGPLDFDELAKVTMNMAMALNREYKSHFDRLDKMENENENS